MDIALKDIFEILKRKIIFIVAGSLIVTICTFCITYFFVPKTYISSVKLYVETINEGTANNNNYNDRNYAVALVNTYKEMLRTNRFFTKVSEEIGGIYSPEQLRDMISFSSLNETEVFQASVSAKSPEDAKKVADSISVIAPEMIGDLKENATLKIVDPPQLPSKHSSPKTLNVTVAAFFISFVLLCLAVILRKVTDTKIMYDEDMTSVNNVPILTAIPLFDRLKDQKPSKLSLKKNGNDEQTAQELGFQVRESYKKARTSIIYSVIKKGCKKIAFTSSVKSEGKTLTATNIAIALAQQVGTRVILVECDLRRPRVHMVLQLKPELGLTNYLNFECELDDIFMETSVSGLSAICYGAIPPNPSELLSSEGMVELVKELEKRFDYVIFDTPPINVVVDAVPVVGLSDGVVVVAKDRETTYSMLDKTLDAVRMANGKVLGVIMNQVKMTEAKKGYYKGYYR